MDGQSTQTISLAYFSYVPYRGTSPQPRSSSTPRTKFGLLSAFWTLAVVICLADGSAAQVPKLLLAGLVVVGLLPTRRASWQTAIVDPWALLGALWILMGAMPVGGSSGSLLNAVRLTSSLLFPYAMVSRLGAVATLRIVTNALAVFTIAGMASVITWSETGEMPNGGWRGLTSHKNVFGFEAAAALTLVVAELLLVRAITRPRRRWLVISGASSVVVIVGCGSAGGIAVAVVGLVLTILIRTVRAILPDVRFALAGLVAIVGAAVVAAATLFDQAVDTLDRDPTLTKRSEIWSAVISEIQRFPRKLTGQGLGYWTSGNPSVSRIWREIDFTPYSAHNSYLDWLLRFGLVGFVILTCFCLRTAPTL